MISISLFIPRNLHSCVQDILEPFVIEYLKQLDIHRSEIDK